MTVQSNITPESIVNDLRYLQLLSRSFPTIADASTEIINLEAILNLPKGTEHFLTDIHGEYEAFQHVLKNASGAVKRKVNEIFGNTLREAEKKEICTLIYYPEEKLQLVKAREKDLDDWYLITLNQLVKVCQNVSSKYTRSKVRKSLPAEFSYIIQELLHESSIEPNKHAYINVIISTIITTKRADDFIIAMCNLIQRLTIDSLHIVGDIYDRGPGAHIIMDTLCNYHNFDIQWGNHDILWMGAASGNDSCIANVIRMSMRYGNLGTLEDGYGINLLPLATFAMDTYADDPCTIFMPKMNFADAHYNEKTLRLITQMHKAITIIQFKLEGQIIERHPEYKMDDRNVLKKINYEKKTVTIEGVEYPLKDTTFPTIDPKKPLELTEGEQELLYTLVTSFRHSELFNRHVEFLYNKGSMYTCCNSNLLYHGCIPMNQDGTFTEITLDGKHYYKGKALLDYMNQIVKDAYYTKDRNAVDFMWYLWCGRNSSVYGKSKMSAFEGYFIEGTDARKEIYNPYYKLSNDEKICDMIFCEFGLNPDTSHIINGHVPVKLKDGESPVKANGKLYVIDGGISKAYRTKTGIAGYTLIFNSHHIALAEHTIASKDRVLAGQNSYINYKVSPVMKITERMKERVRVADTDTGAMLRERIKDLKMLVKAYEDGQV